MEVDQDHTSLAPRQGQSVDVCQTGPVYDSGLVPVSSKWMFSRSGQSVAVCQTDPVRLDRGHLLEILDFQVSQWEKWLNANS